MIYMNGTAGKMAISDNGEVRTAFIRAKADAERERRERQRNPYCITITIFGYRLSSQN
ncbi:MAG: hypothetical protein R2941_14545 [Desulfobacterales bacterium]